MHIVSRMLQQESSIYKCSASDDYDALKALEEKGIISVYDNTADQWTMSHDVYEELIVKHILNQRYQEGIKSENILGEFGLSLRARKLYRIWLESIFTAGQEDYVGFLFSVLQSSLDQVWKDETLIAFMQADQMGYFHIIDPMLSQNNYQLFTRMVFLLNTACLDIDKELIKKMPTLTIRKYRFTRPVGRAWYTVFQYIYNNRNLIPWTTQNLSSVANALKTWTDKNKSGKTTKLAGKIAFYLKKYQWEHASYHHILKSDTVFITFTNVILAASMELKQELTEIFQSVENMELYNDGEDENNLLLKKSLSNIFDCGNVAQAIPAQVIHLAEHHWCYLPQEKYHYDLHHSIEYIFGLSPNLDFEYQTESAFQTPVLFLLQTSPFQTIDMILRIMNHTTACYKDSILATEDSECSQIELHFSDGTTQRQICSNRLWQMYRGTSVAPNLLKSILMALEKWLLKLVEDDDGKNSCQLCEYLLRHSQTASVTAVVLSIVIAYPYKLFPISCILLKTKEIFLLDISRLAGEHGASFFKGTFPAHHQFDQERIESNALPFRQKRFEEILMNYQIERAGLSEEQWQKLQIQLYAAFDEAIQDINSWEETYRFAYYRSDLRKCKISCQKVSTESTLLYIEPNMPENLVSLSIKTKKDSENIMQHMPLMLWANANLQNDQNTAKMYSKFDDNIDLVINEIHQILEKGQEELPLDYSAAVNACSVLVQKKRFQMDEQELAFCKDVLLSAGLSLLEQESYSDSFKINHVSLSLSSLISSDNLTADWSSPLFMLLALVMAQGSALNSIANILWTSVPTAALKLMYVYAVLIPKVSFAVYPYRDISVKKFFDENGQHIQQLFQTNVSRLEEIPIENLKVSQLIYLQRMLPSNPAYASFNFVIKIGKLIWDELFNSNNTKDRNSYRNYEGEYAYIKWLGDYVLNLSSENQSFFLEELMPRVNYKHKREFSHLLVAIIASEDMNPRYNAFWGLWSLLRNYLLSDFERTYQSKQLISGDHATDYGLGNVLAEYLLAGPYWKEGVTVWHSLREDSATFYVTVKPPGV